MQANTEALATVPGVLLKTLSPDKAQVRRLSIFTSKVPSQTTGAPQSLLPPEKTRRV